LGVVKLGEDAAFAHQLGEAAALDNIALAQHEDQVRAAYSREPMGDDEGCTACAQPSDAFHHHGLGLDIER